MEFRQDILHCMMSKLKDMILFWGAGSAPCWRAMACLNEKELHDRLESKEMDFDKNEHKSEEVMKLNPRGQVRDRLKRWWPYNRLL